MKLPTFALICALVGAMAWPAAAQLRISEFMAGNTRTLADEDGSYEDWIEIQNFSAAPVNLENWCLTDSASSLAQWRFPATNLSSGGYLVVFASSKNRRTPGKPLHTNFKLNAAGEYLALVQPDGTTVVSEFAPVFPPQLSDISYGFGVASADFTLVSSNDAVRVLIPMNGAFGFTWTLPGFDDSAWRQGTNGVGFDTGVADPVEDLVSGVVAGAGPIAWWRFEEGSGTVATNLGSLGAAVNATYLGGFTLAQAGPQPPTYAGFEATNRAPRFDGSSGRVQIPDNGAFDLATEAFSIAMWFSPANVSGRGDLFTYKGTGGDFGIHVASQGASTISVYHNGFIGTAGTLVNNQWYCFVFTRTASGAATACLNGAVLFTGTDTQTMNIANDLLIGSNHSGSPGTISIPFNGLIDEVAIYNRALTTNEIFQQYRAALGTGVSFTNWIKTDVRAAMNNVNSSVFIRIPFSLSDVSQVSRLLLHVKYDDGFVAYLNGQEAISVNAPDTNVWNSAATARHTDSAALVAEDFNISDMRGFLVPGTNILAIQGLNITASNSDFLILPELTATVVSNTSTTPRYFTTPTPGDLNVGGTTNLGPIITSVDHTPALPARPADNDDIIVTAKVTPAFGPVTNVTMRYCVMYGAEVPVPMLDDGAHGDGAAGDGVFGATIPASASTPSQMVRYCVTAADSTGRASRFPTFEDPLATPQYLGTVVADPTVTSALPIWEWFSANTAAAITRTGARCSVFFNGEFFDNLFVRLRGGFTLAGAQKFNFNSGYHAKISDAIGRVNQVNLNTIGSDPTYTRPPLAFETIRNGGNEACMSYHMLMRANGGADRVGIYVEEVDDNFLQRNGLDQTGALYKFVQRAAGTPVFTDATDGVEKKTRLTEDNSDLQAFVNGLGQADAAARRAWFFDNLHVPNFLGYAALRSIIQDADDVRKNFYMYRDTVGTREWRIFPWDKDWTYGIVGDGGWGLPHPFFGDYIHRKPGSDQWNKLYEFAFNDPVIQPLMLRHLRTVMDQWLQPPGTPASSGKLEARAIAWMQPLVPHLGVAVSNQISGILNYITQRRTGLYVTYAATNAAAGATNALVPTGQPTNVVIAIGAIDFNPASGNQAEEYIQLTNANNFAVDISGWSIQGAVDFTFETGTVIGPMSGLFVSSDLNAFRARATGPRGGQGLFVVGPFSGQLSARGETVLVLNDTGSLVASNTYPGSPSLAQQFLRITEIMYNPAPLAGNTNDAQEFEFLELKNISPVLTLDLHGVRFTNGVEFSFTGSAVTNLGPGQRVLVVRNVAAFAARYGSLTNVAGAYVGALNNGGERLTLLDASGEEVLDFSYNNSWYPFTDGQGFSLVVVDETAPPDAWGHSSNWRASAYEHGSPGVAEPNPPSIAPVFVSELLSHPDVALGQTEAVELFNPNTNDVDLSGWYLSDNASVPKKYRLPHGTVLPAGAYLVVTEAEFNPGGLGFGFSSLGEEVRLFSGDTNGVLTGFTHGFNFGAAEAGVSFGRHLNSQGSEDFVAMAAPTFGTNNALPQVGPVVINEIMYHPPALTSNDPPASFIELLNITATNVPLFHASQPTNTWHLRNAADFDFPTNVTLPPGGAVLVVGFDPATNAAALAAFRLRYSVDTNVPVFGPWQGSLPNNDGAIELKKPDPSVSLSPPNVLVDKVHYYDTSPWPCGTDGTGASLQRQRPGEYGNDPINWAGAPPTAGQTNAVVPPGAPTITTAPTAQTTTYFASASFSVVACGLPQYFQWQFHGTNLPLATNATLLIPNAQPESAGPYAVVVWNPAGSVTSAPVLLTVQAPPPPGLTGQPVSRVIAVSNAVSLSVVVTGAPPISFQWCLAGTNLPGATSNPFALASAQFSDAGTYTVVVSNPGGSVTSAPAILRVLQPPVFTLQPQSQSVFAGSNATFTVAVNASAPLFLQWLCNGTNLPNATNATLTLPNVQAAQAGAYQARATNLVGVAFSDAATLIVPVPIVITTPPASQSAWPYSNVTFAVTQTGSQPIGYQWRWAGTNLPNATNASLTKTSVLPADAGSYSVLITNTISAVTSAPAVLTIYTNPLITTQPFGRSAAVGSNATFTVAAFSSTPLRYQWFFNTNTPLAGATNDTLTFTNVQTSNYGFYTARVFDNFGFTNSDAAQMADKLKPTITQQPTPTNTVLLLGTPLTLTMSAVGPTPLSFRWRRGGNTLTNAIQNETVSTYAIPAGPFTNLSAPYTNVSAGFTYAGGYDVVVTNSAGNAPSSTRAYVTIMEPLTNRTARLGSNVTFTFLACSAWSNVANTTYTLRYHWWFNETNLLLSLTNMTLSLTNITLNLTNVQYAHEGTYKAVVTTSNATVGSQSATLTILRPPTITDQPTNQTVAAGDPATFTVTATGVPPPSYQWWFNQTNPLAGATSPTLTLTNAQTLQAGGYSVVVSNSLSAVTSLVAQLTVTVSAPPHLDSVLGPPAPGGLFQFSFGGVAGQSYSVLWREFLDKDDWQPLTNLSLLSSNQPVLIQDSTAGQTQRFYRVVMPSR